MPNKTKSARERGTELKYSAARGFLTGRLIKYFANGLRPLFYLHYWLSPKTRYQIVDRPIPYDPGKTDLLIQLKNTGIAQEIPNIVWQTNYTHLASLPLKACLEWNKIMSEGYHYRFMATDSRLNFVEENFPGRVHRLYNKLNLGAAQADLWRLLVLYKYGGVYMDIDAHLLLPLKELIQPETQEIYLRYKKSMRFTNYFIATKPESFKIKALLNEALRRIEDPPSNNVYNITGPDVFDSVLDSHSPHWRYTQNTCLQGDFTNKFFQYIDRPNGFYGVAEKHISVVSD